MTQAALPGFCLVAALRWLGVEEDDDNGDVNGDNDNDDADNGDKDDDDGGEAKWW